MRNTNYNSTDVLSNVISQETNVQAVQGLMQDLGLEIEDALAL